MLLGLALFVALYVGAIAATIFLLSETWQLEARGRGGVWLLIGGTVLFGFLLAFFVKGFFHVRRRDLAGLVEITRVEEPRLFGFLDGLLGETGAPPPKRVYLSADVNAAVFYDTSILSLVLPVRKNLLIGLGLVNALTVSELKAVLGHELGHFAQSSMRLGQYVYVANGIIHDLVWGRDTWDDLLENAKRIDFRIAVFAWILAAIVWLLRRALGGVFWVMNLAQRSLSREMEFQADRVAVSVAGSDAITRGLYRAAFADACFAQTAADLTHAADHGIRSRDFFHHQERAAEWVRARSRKPAWGLVPEGSGESRMLFADDLESKPSMWATHPPSAERERAAKSPYVACRLDDRPAWTLFASPERVREKLTRTMIELAEGAKAAKDLRPAEEVQRWIDAEREDVAFEGRYSEMYDGRPLAADLDVRAAFAAAGGAEPAALLAAHASLWDEEVARLCLAHRERRDELQLALRAATGQLRGATFQFRGQERPHADAIAVARELGEELQKIDRKLEKRDHRVLDVHAKMAAALGEAEAFELRERYAFQLAVQRAHGRVQTGHRALDESLQGGAGQMEEEDFLVLREALRGSLATLQKILRDTKEVSMPPLRNMIEGQGLGDFLTPRTMPTAGGIEGGSIQGDWIGRLFGAYAEVADKLARISRKSLGAILAQQERIAEAYRARAAPPVEDAPAEGAPAEGAPAEDAPTDGA